MTSSSGILSSFQMQKCPPFKSSSSPLSSSSSSFSQHQVLKNAKQHIAMILSDHRGLNSLFNSIQPLDKPNAVAILDSISHATAETKRFSLSLIPGTSLCVTLITSCNHSLLKTQMAAFPDGSWTKASLFLALLSTLSFIIIKLHLLQLLQGDDL